ncbi:MAG TPA: TerC family protein [Burkholderiaceae bacterium]|nr:TerC family protein [Burkholderiaceae bacterium]
MDFGAFIASLDIAILLQIVLIDLLLGGDNAVVIALACRNLPKQQRTKGILWGTAGAIILRVILVAFAVTLLQVPGLKLVGGLLLLWIGIKLMLPDEDGHGDIAGSASLWGAVRTIIVADLVMSIDNVIAIAGAAQQTSQGQELFYVIFGLVVSIPIIVYGSQLVLKLMDRFPLIITAGAALLGFIAGSLIVSDPLITRTFGILPSQAGNVAGAIGAVLVVVVARVALRLRARASKHTGT